MKHLIKLFVISIATTFAVTAIAQLRRVQTTSGCNFTTGQNLPNMVFEYDGDCVNGAVGGFGVMRLTSNGRLVYTIEGQFSNGTVNGIALMKAQSTIKDNDFKTRFGEFKDGQLHGLGSETVADQGLEFIGNFRNGSKNGLGVLLFQGVKFIGEYVNDYESGNGVGFEPNGRIVIGEYKRGRLNGKGAGYRVNSNQVVDAGTYSDGILVSKAIAPVAPDDLQLEIKRALDEEGKLKEQIDKINIKYSQLLKTKAATNQPTQTIATQQAVAVKPLNIQPAKSLSTGVRRALVIGNDNYASVKKLENAREDARTLSENLIAVGYQVTLKLDLNEKEMKSAIRTFASQVQGGDEVMFFFAGHGVQLGAANYLLPIDIVGDSEAQVRDEAIQLQRVLDDIAEKKAKFTLAMIDACRDNPFKSPGRAIGGRGLAPTTAATGQMVIFSAGTGQQALDKLSPSDKNKNGLFTRIFVQEMQKPSQSIDRVVKNVRNQVAELAKSAGHDQVPAIYDQVLGDFYFKK